MTNSHRVAFSTQVNERILQRLRATVFGMQHLDPTITLAAITEAAIAEYCAHLEAEHNQGVPWPTPPVPTRRGTRLQPR